MATAEQVIEPVEQESRAPYKTLSMKLVEVARAIDHVEKAGKNVDQKYDYVKAADVARIMRAELYSRGILITQREKSCIAIFDVELNSGKKRPVILLEVEYHVEDTNSGEALTYTAYGTGTDGGDKALYKAKTGALKYFLRGLALIPDESDPENDANEHIDKHEKAFEEREAAQAENIGPDPDARIPAFKVRAIEEACQSTGKSEFIISAHLAEIGAGPQLEYLTNAQFQDFLKWASTRQAQADPVVAIKRSLGAVGACPDCGKKMVPAGTSMKTGKPVPYAAFCGNKNCPGKKKPQRLPKEESAPGYDGDVPF